MKNIDLAFSPCPNDTFTFHAMLHHFIDTRSLSFTPYIDDVETLNKEAFKNTYAVTKLSFFAYIQLKQHYELLDAGAALGYGCGPLVVAKSDDISISTARIAVPGEYTTANLLLHLWKPDVGNIVVTRFDDILPGVQSGKYDAGVIIHEGRFVYPEYGCIQIIDLGEWWETKTALPIPLGCIAVRKDAEILSLKEDIEHTIKNSVQYAFDNPDASRDFTKTYSQELDDAVIDQHISLYVNEFSLSLGEIGWKAVKTLEEMVRIHDII